MVTAPEEQVSAGTIDGTGPPTPSVQELDIRTSTLAELAQWCRQLGLSDGGTREELANRLREYYGLTTESSSMAGTAADSNADTRTITIESARSSEYFTLETVNESYARLKGTVVITVKEKDTLHRLSADEIIFNRTRNIVNARGHVQYSREGGDVRESFTGESLTLSLDDWQGLFFGGSSERSLSEKTTAYRFSGNVISRDGEEVTVLSDAEITNAKIQDSYWSINASKLWLLPGSDWAIFNAVLKVGEIPLLYIPFFYLPGDEVIFHPVLGYRSREGSFVQTTTYLLGRPKASSSSENSITRILGSGADTERRKEGLFLRSTGKRSAQKDETSLSLLFDVYANLGVWAGMNASFPKQGILGKTDLSIGIGMSRDIYQPAPNYYTPYRSTDGVSTWNSSLFFGYKLPVRYRIKNSGSLLIDPLTLSWDLPLYSDPFIERDFLQRSEYMDWLEILKQGSNQINQSYQVPSALGSYQWRLSAAFGRPIFEVAPTLFSLSINNLASSLAFSTRSVQTPASPLDSLFFYPERLTLYTASLSIRGTPIKIDAPLSSQPTSPATGQIKSDAHKLLQDPLRDPPQSWSLWASEDATSPTAVQNNRNRNKETPFGNLEPPPIQQNFEVPLSSSAFKYSLEYSLSPAFSTELFFRNNAQRWPDPQSVRWDDIASVFTNFRSDGRISTTLSDTASFFTTTLNLYNQSAFQKYNYINEEAEEFDTESERNSAILKANTGTYTSLSPELVCTLSPLKTHDVWSATNLKYSVKGLFLKTAFQGDLATGTWNTTYGTWSKEYISTHQLELALAARTGNQTQNVSFSVNLPPLDIALNSKVSFALGISQTSVSFAIVDPFDEPIYKPVIASEVLQFSPRISMRQDIVYDPGSKDLTSATSSLNLYGFTIQYSAKRTPSDTRLQGQNFSFSYVDSFKAANLWKNRISYALDVNSNLAVNLQNYSASVFTFSLGTTLKISQFLDLSFSSRSQNSVVFRYFQDLPWIDSPVTMPGEKNVFIDLLNSFRFDNEALRKSSGFKLKALNMKVVHYMGDWNATLGVDLQPYLNTAKTPKR
ncbi:MAG: LPS-assembly protein LptD [Termitinemataceae bacterium]